MAAHHQLWKLAVHFNNLVLKKKIQNAFDHDDLYGNISKLLRQWLSWNHYLGQRESIWASTFGGYFNNQSGKLYFSSIVLLLLELLTKPLFIPSGLTKGNQVTMGH